MATISRHITPIPPLFSPHYVAFGCWRPELLWPANITQTAQITVSPQFEAIVVEKIGANAWISSSRTATPIVLIE